MFSKPLIAIDIGSSSIKIVEFGGSSKKSLTKIGLELLPSSAIVDSEIKDPGRVSQTIKNLIDRLGISPKGRNVALSVGGSGVLVKRASMAIKKEEEVGEQVFYEAQQLFQHDMEDMFFWYQELKTKVVAEGKRAILLVGVKRDIVEQHMAVVRTLGLGVKVVDCDILCISNMFDHNYPAPSSLVALVNIGATATQVILTHGGEFLYTREFFLGGNEFTSRIAEVYGIEFDSAEALKVDVSLGKQPVTTELQKIFRDVNEALILDVKSTINFFLHNEQVPEGVKGIGYACLSGGGARSLGLDAAIAASLQVPVQITNPFQRIEINSKNIDVNYLLAQGPLYGIAAGLALRKIGDSDKRSIL